jgi:hypothetical protein
MSFTDDDEVVTRSHGAALHLFCLGYPVLSARSRTDSLFECFMHFPAAARPALEAYYIRRGELNAELAKYIKPQRSE